MNLLAEIIGYTIIGFAVLWIAFIPINMLAVILIAYLEDAEFNLTSKDWKEFLIGSLFGIAFFCVIVTYLYQNPIAREKFQKLKYKSKKKKFLEKLES